MEKPCVCNLNTRAYKVSKSGELSLASYFGRVTRARREPLA